MNSLSCLAILAIIIIAITNYSSTVNGYVILRNQLQDDINNFHGSVQNDNINGYNLIQYRSKRSPQNKAAEVYSPEFGDGYYVFPADGTDESARNFRRKQSNLQYRPLLSYKTLKTKKKRLFVPNLFG